MAKYWEDWSGSTLNEFATGWTRRLNTAYSLLTVLETANELAPAGRMARLSNDGTNARAIISFDAVDADPDKNNFTISALCWVAGLTGAATSRGGVAGRAGGTGGGGETGFLSILRTTSSGSATASNDLTRYVNGTFTEMSRSGNGTVVGATPYWFELQVEDLGGGNANVTRRLRNGETPTTILYQDTVETNAIPDDGWIGLFCFNASYNTDVFAVAIATGTDEIFFEAPSTEPVAVNFSGTVPTLNGTEGEAFSESVASYFSGTETPFVYTRTAGDTLPEGWSFDADTATFSNADPAPVTISGNVVRATDATPNTADTNAFDIVIAASDTTAPVLSSPTGTATGPTTASGTVTTDEANGTLYAVATTSVTPPGETDIRDGTGAAYATSQAVSATGVQNVSATGLTAETTYYWHFLHDDAAGNASNIATSASFTTDAAASVVKGVRVTTSAVSVTGLTAMWWDSNPPTGNPAFATDSAATDSSGDLELNLNATTALDVGQHGTLVLYKLDGTDHQDSLGAVSRLTIEDIA